MSKFHFNENVMDTVTAYLKTISENISSTESKINSVIIQLYGEEGFDIGLAVNALSAELVNISRCVEKIINITTATTDVLNLVSQYDMLAYKNEYIDIVNCAKKNDKYLFRMYDSETAHFTDKYCYNFFTIISQIGTAFKENITGADINAYQEYYLKKTIKDVISDAVNDYKISTPLKEFVDAYSDYNTLISTFDKKYKSSPILKYCKEMNFDKEMIEILLNDYDNNMEYLNSLERSLVYAGYDDKVIKNVIKDIKDDFDNKYLLSVKKTFAYGAEQIAKEALRTNPIGMAVLSTLDIMDLMDTKSDSKMEYAVINDFENKAIDSYNTLTQKINSGINNEQDLIDYKNLFEVIRNMKISKYSIAKEFVNPFDMAVCNEAIEYYTNLKMS